MPRGLGTGPITLPRHILGRCCPWADLADEGVGGFGYERATVDFIGLLCPYWYKRHIIEA